MPETKTQWKQWTVRMPRELLDRVRGAIGARQYHDRTRTHSQNEWFLEAVQEKLERERTG